MSPEQIRGEPLDHRSDLFSFGIVLYEIVHRPHSFVGRTLAETVDRILHLEPAADDLSEHVAEDIGRAVVRASAKERRLRYPTIVELRLELRRPTG